MIRYALRCERGHAFDSWFQSSAAYDSQRKRGYGEARLAVLPSFSADGRTVDLRVTALRGPIVRVVFTGDSVPADRRDELAPVLREGTTDEDLLEDSSRAIVDYFRARGYRDAINAYTREQTGDELTIDHVVPRSRGG